MNALERLSDWRWAWRYRRGPSRRPTPEDMRRLRAFADDLGESESERIAEMGSLWQSGRPVRGIRYATRRP